MHLVGTEGVVYGVDASAEMLARATRRWGNRPQLHLCQDWYGEGSPAAAGELDAVLFSYSLTMAPSVGVALDRAVRDLRPGGWLGAVDFLSTVGPVGRSLLGRYPLEMGTHLRDAVANRIAEPTLSIERRSWCGLWRWFLLGGRV